MKILVIGNLSDRRCGFQNFSQQTVTALQRAGHAVTAWDGTYTLCYQRREENTLAHYFLPDDAADYDVIHVVWHPATLNHYSGCVWPQGPVISIWNGCPTGASCPFMSAATIRWSVLEEDLATHRWGFYPIPVWIDTSDVEPADEFTVGWSGVRGDGLGDLQTVCARRGWATNFSQPDTWLSLEDEVRRLARSTVNVCWYGAGNNDRGGAVMTCLASRRPQLINQVPMFWHLREQPDLYQAPHGQGDWNLPTLEIALTLIERMGEAHRVKPEETWRDFGWPAMVRRFEIGWQMAMDGAVRYDEQRACREGY